MDKNTEAFQKSFGYIEPAIVAIITNNLKFFIAVSDNFDVCRNGYSDYLTRSISYGRHDFIKYIVETCESNIDDDKNGLVNVFSSGLDRACEIGDLTTAVYLISKIQKKCNKEQFYAIINTAAMKSVVKYSKEAPDMSFINMLLNAGADINYTSNVYPYSLIGAALDTNKCFLALSLINLPGFDITKHQPPSAPYYILNSLLSSNSINYEARVRIIDKLIELGADVNSRGFGFNKQSFSPAGLACMNGDIASLYTLIKAGADIYTKDISGNSVVDYAKSHKKHVLKSMLNIVRYIETLTGKPLEDNLTKEDKSMFSSIKKDNLKLLLKALDKGADPNAINKYGVAPLAYAILMKRDIKTLKALLAAGADPNATDDRGITTLSLPALWFSTPPVNSVEDNRLLYKGVRVPDTDIKTTNLTKQYQNFNSVLLNIKEVVGVLLDAGADPNIKTNDKTEGNKLAGEDPLFFGLLLNILNEYTKIYWRDTYSHERAFNYEDILPELEKCRSLIEDIFQMMLDKGLNPNYRVDQRNSLINAASVGNFNSVLKMLFDAGINFNSDINSNTSTLILAIPINQLTSDITKDFMQVPVKLKWIDPTNPVGMGPGERGLSDLEMYEKIQAIKDTVTLLFENGLSVNTERVKTEMDLPVIRPVYRNFNCLKEFILGAEERTRVRLKLKSEDTREYIRTDFEFDI